MAHRRPSARGEHAVSRRATARQLDLVMLLQLAVLSRLRSIAVAVTTAALVLALGILLWALLALPAPMPAR